jgi:hypothetical protein
MTDARIFIGADLDELKRGIRDAKSQMTSMQQAGESVGRAMAGIGATVAGALSIGAITAFTRSMAAAADQIGDTSEAVGLSSRALQEFRAAAVDAGGSSAAMDAALGALQRNIGEAATQGGAAAQSFQRLGLSASMLTSLGTEQALLEVADAIAQLPTHAERAAATQQLLGRASSELVPFVSAGSAGIRAMTDEAERLNLVMDEQTIATLGAAQQTFDRLQIAATVAGAQIAAGFTPFLSAAMEAILEADGRGQGLTRTMESVAAGATGLYVVGRAAFAGLEVAIFSLGMAYNRAMAMLTFGDMSRQFSAMANNAASAVQEAAARMNVPAELDRVGGLMAQSWMRGAVGVELSSPRGAAAGGGRAGAVTASAGMEALLGRNAIDSQLYGLTTATGASVVDPRVEAERLRNQQILDLQNEHNAAMVAGIDLREQTIIEAVTRSAETQRMIEEVKAASTGELARMGVDMAIDALGRQSKAGKAFAIADATITALAGANRALKDVPFPKNLVAAGLVLANGMARVQQIRSINPGGGSVTGGAGGAGGGFDSTAALDRIASANAQTETQSRPQAQVIIQGNVFGTRETEDFIANALKKGIEERDLVIITPNSRQALELMPA